MLEEKVKTITNCGYVLVLAAQPNHPTESCVIECHKTAINNKPIACGTGNTYEAATDNLISKIRNLNDTEVSRCNTLINEKMIENSKLIIKKEEKVQITVQNPPKEEAESKKSKLKKDNEK